MTADMPPTVSIIDVVSAVTGLNGNNAAMAFARLKDKYPVVTARCGDVEFPDPRGRRGQRGTPATDVRGIVEVTMLLPGRMAARVRHRAAELSVRYLGGDIPLGDIPLSAAVAWRRWQLRVYKW